MPKQIALLGAVRSGRHALLRELAPRLLGTCFEAQVVDELADLKVPALVLLLAPRDAAGEPQDLQWRERLAAAGIGFSVLHGDQGVRLEGAWRLVRPLLGQPAEPLGSDSSRWVWSCDKCSDPACEHRLFQDLLQGRRSAG